jgi:cyclopropane fatty-acyl-phospholipid synthase-like methyltransferase
MTPKATSSASATAARPGRADTVVATRAEAETIERFTDRYRLCCSPVRLAIESDALDADYGSTGYTTRAQADELARHLRLRSGDRLADIGAGAGWPGLYLAQQTGCHVIGTDLPLDGLRRARARAIEDGLAGRASYAQATGRSQPLRAGSFDAVVHTDVLCCLGPKLAVLRACHRLLRPGGRLAFTTIHVAPDLDAARHRRAVRAGPPQVATRRPYPELVAQAGFRDIDAIDVTQDYARTQRAWLEANELRAAEVRRITSVHEFATAQADRRFAQSAIEEGLLRRSLITATRR